MKIQVCQDQDFRRKVALAVVTEAHPGYSRNSQGGHYADPVEGRVYRVEANRAWNPWPDSVDYRIVGCDDLVRQEGNDFSDVVDWKVVSLPSYRSMAIAFLQSEGESLEDNGDIPEWVDPSDVIAFARDQSEQWQEEIEEQEKLASEMAIEFALGEILDEIEIEDLSEVCA